MDIFHLGFAPGLAGRGEDIMVKKGPNVTRCAYLGTLSFVDSSRDLQMVERLNSAANLGEVEGGRNEGNRKLNSLMVLGSVRMYSIRYVEIWKRISC